MKGVLENSLFETQPHKFEHLNELTRQFATIYCGNSIVKDNIFAVIENYARKKEIHLEILRFPIHDEELWAMTFLKKGTIFVCVNSELALCKQFFAAAHELYHIYCYVEDADQSYIKNGSMLDSDTANETGKTQEDVEANAFAGLLLMPDQLLSNQIDLFGIDKDDMDTDSVLSLMDMFAIPYKAREDMKLRKTQLSFRLKKMNGNVRKDGKIWNTGVALLKYFAGLNSNQNGQYGQIYAEKFTSACLICKAFYGKMKAQ